MHTLLQQMINGTIIQPRDDHAKVFQILSQIWEHDLHFFSIRWHSGAICLYENLNTM